MQLKREFQDMQTRYRAARADLAAAVDLLALQQINAVSAFSCMQICTRYAGPCSDMIMVVVACSGSVSAARRRRRRHSSRSG